MDWLPGWHMAQPMKFAAATGQPCGECYSQAIPSPSRSNLLL